MWIKPGEATTTPALVSGRTMPAAAPLGASEPQLTARDGLASVAVSVALRTLAAALHRLASQGSDEEGLSAALTVLDQEALVAAYQFASEHGVDPVEVDKLLLDLCVYRKAAGASEKGPVAAGLEGAGALSLGAKRVDPKPLQWQGASRTQATLEAGKTPFGLVELRAEDESTARVILASLALRDTALDPLFVRDLLDPDRASPPTVDFGLLKRLVWALSPAHVEGAVDPAVSFDERDARATLVGIAAALGAGLKTAPQWLPERLARGGQLLIERLWMASPGEGAQVELHAPAPAEGLAAGSSEEISAAPATAARAGLALGPMTARALASGTELAPVSLQSALRVTLPVTRQAQGSQSESPAETEALSTPEAVPVPASSAAALPVVCTAGVRDEAVPRSTTPRPEASGESERIPFSALDRPLVAALYAEAEAQGCDLCSVDAFAAALSTLRKAQAESGLNPGSRPRLRSLYPTRVDFDRATPERSSSAAGQDAPRARARESVSPFGSSAQLAAKLTLAYGATAPARIPASAAAQLSPSLTPAVASLLEGRVEGPSPGADPSGVSSAWLPRAPDAGAQGRDVAALLPRFATPAPCARRAALRRFTRGTSASADESRSRELEDPIDADDEPPRPRWRWLIRQRTRLHRR